MTGNEWWSTNDVICINFILSSIVSISDMGRDGEYSVKRVLKDLSKASPPKQLAVGAGTGWLIGYTTMKLGKAVATTIGGTILLLQASTSQVTRLN